MIQQNKGDSKTTWKILKQLLPKCSTGGITSLEINGTLISNFKDICNAFNTYFIDIGTQLAASIPNVVNVPLDYLNSFLQQQTKTFNFKSVNANDVYRQIMNIPNGKATGLDNLQARLLKISAPAISSSLAFIFNLSLSSGEFPRDWKQARITPIHKKGPKAEPGNYRPVSVLPVISKFMERIVHQQLYDFLNETNQSPQTQ
jgi:hypothetical protein